MTSMRIGFDVSQTCSQRAGCGWFADSLARALASGPDTGELLLYHHFDSWINACTHEGTRIEGDRVAAPLWEIPMEEARTIWENIQRNKSPLPGCPDIVHSNNFCALPVAPAKLVYTLYDLSFWTHPEYTTEANRLACQAGVLNALKYADGFVFISEFSRYEFERLLPGYLERTLKPSCVIYPAARGGEVESPFQVPEDYWLCVGSLEPRKNHKALLSALELYWERSDSPKPLKICGGPGWMSGPLRDQIRKMESQGKVECLDYVSDRELERLYAGAYGLIFPSFYEGFGLPVVEAMNQGCPVICSGVASMPEIGGLDAVHYIDPRRPEEISHAMLEWEHKPSMRDELARRGRDRATLFTWSQSARKLLEFYQEVLSSSSARNSATVGR